MVICLAKLHGGCSGLGLGFNSERHLRRVSKVWMERNQEQL